MKINKIDNKDIKIAESDHDDYIEFYIDWKGRSIPAWVMTDIQKETIEEFMKDLVFDGECYKMSIKNHNKWEEKIKE